jgi:NAD(P)-dependent dehydrogenase (short-subunit alcohol dehydrogenase family)
MWGSFVGETIPAMPDTPTALVTGGARRIGAAIGRDLADSGFAVAAHCNRSLDEAKALVAEVGWKTREVVGVPS